MYQTSCCVNTVSELCLKCSTDVICFPCRGIMELIGIFVGHLYFFLMFKYPQDFGGQRFLSTPSILYVCVLIFTMCIFPPLYLLSVGLDQMENVFTY